MGLFSKPPAAAPSPAAGTTYTGPVGFHEGVHYPAPTGDCDLARPLMWLGDQDDDTDEGRYVHWDGQGGDHRDRYHRAGVELEVGDPA
jgi:hypothetical protein